MSLTISPSQIVDRAISSGSPGLLVADPAWPRVALGSLVRIVNGAAFPSAGFNTDSRGMPLVRIRDVGRSEPATYFEGGFDPAHLVNRGDLLVGMDGDFRLARWKGPTALLNQRVCRLEISDDRLTSSWLEHIAQGYLDAIWRETSSITVKHLSSKAIAQIPLPLPPREEQVRIIDLLEDHLSRLDAATEYVQAAGRRCSTLVASVLATATPGGSLVSLGSLATSSGYGTSTKCVVDGPGPAVVRIPNLIDRGIDLGDEKRVADRSIDVSRAMLEPGDLLIVRTNGSRELIGRAAVVQPGIKAAYASYLIRYQLDRARALPAWVQLVLESPQMRARIEDLAASSAGQYNLSLSKLNTLQIPLPSLEQQAAAVQRMSDVIADASRLEQTVLSTARRARTLRDALLQAAFSGRLTNSPGESVKEVAAV